MAKFQHSVCIRIGASYDDVTVATQDGPMYFDRAALSKQRHEGTPAERMDAKASLYGLRKGVIDAFVLVQAQKDRRRNRRDRKVSQKAIAA